MGLSLSEDIVCITTDGASVMRKIGHLIDPEQQLCFAHGIHLAILSVLYKSPEAEPVVVEENPAENVDIDLNHEPDPERIDEDGDTSTNNPDENIFLVSNESEANIEEPLTHGDLLPLIHKIRKVIKLFRKSPVKNDSILQRYVVMEHGCEKQLILDSKTRWSSLLTMLERFYELRSAIQKSLIDLNVGYSFSEEDFKLLADVISVLLPIKHGVESLCRRDANLLTADATFKFLLTNLEKCNGQLAQQLKHQLVTRIKERRTDVSSLLQYLHKRYNDNDESCHFGIFKKLPRTQILKMSTTILNRIGKYENDDIASEAIADTEEVGITPILHDTPTNSKNVQHLLQKAIETELGVPKINVPGPSLTIQVRRELAQFECDGVRDPKLQRVYNYLLSIPPTSVEAERAFSSSGKICTKLRSRLADSSLDTLCILREHFYKKKSV